MNEKKLIYEKIRRKCYTPNKLYKDVLADSAKQNVIDFYNELSVDAKPLQGTPKQFKDFVSKGTELAKEEFTGISRQKIKALPPTLLIMNQPTYPHIDGPLYYIKNFGFILKTLLFPIAIKKQGEWSLNDNVIFTTFKEHANFQYTLGGIEFDKLFKTKEALLQYKKTDLSTLVNGNSGYYYNNGALNVLYEDEFFNKVNLSEDSWITDQNQKYFSGMLKSYDHKRKTFFQTGANVDQAVFNPFFGFTNPSILEFNLGDLYTFNPYQTHASADFTFEEKLVLRVNLYYDF